MAVKQVLIAWPGLGGSTSGYVPDGLMISCHCCGRDLGNGTNLAMFEKGGKLHLGVQCDCGFAGELEPPDVKFK